MPRDALSEHPTRMSVLSERSEAKDLSSHLTALECAFTLRDGVSPLESVLTQATRGGGSRVCVAIGG